MDLDKNTIYKLVKKAIEAKEKATAPQSNISVGAALLTKDGNMLPGCNVELKILKGIHAEVNALSLALYSGYRNKDFIAIAIVYGNNPEEPPYPACAECRQWLWEYTNPDLIVIVANTKGKILYQSTIKDLYPMPYPAYAPQSGASAGKPAK